MVAGSITVVLLWWLRPWSQSLRVPLMYGGDWLIYAMNTKNIIETGWFQRTDRLGAPFGQELYDFPLGGDNGNYLLVRIITLFTDDFALALNLFFLGTFFSIGCISYVVLRMLRTARAPAVVAAIVYSLAPFHFLRLEHLLLSHYAVVPVGVLLACRSATGLPIFRRDRPWATAAWLGACVAVGSFGAYYAIFTLLTVALAAIIAASATRSLRPAVTGASAVLAVGITMVVNQASSLLYWIENGPNALVGARLPIETDLYGLRVIQMLAPVPGTRLPFPATIDDVLSEGFPSEPSMYLGIIGAICLVSMLLWIVHRVGSTSVRSAASAALPLLAAITLCWILIASTGGLSWLVWIAGMERIRGWGRSSILIHFLVLAWVCVALSGRRWLTSARAPLALAVALGVVLLAVADQVTPAVARSPGAFVEPFESDRAYFAAIERDLDPGSAVAQLPIRRFPEELPQVGTRDYDLVRPYLHTNSVRWSHGGMKGRESEWQQELLQRTTPDVVKAFVAFGFGGVLIDRAGFEDRGAAIEQELSALTGSAPVISPDGRWSYIEFGDALERWSESELRAVREQLENASP
jgi:phosphoglycerol transferase